MSGTTTPDAIYYATTGDSFDPASESSLQATSIQTALTARIVTNRQIQTYKWANFVARDAQTGMAEGDVGDQADTDQRWRYSGSAWVDVTGAYSPVIPTATVSVGSAPVSANGKISFSGITTAGTLRLNCDKATLALYSRIHLLIDMEAGTAATTVTFALRLADGATINSANSYFNHSSLITAGVASVLNSTGTSLGLGASRRYQKGLRYEFSDLAVAHETTCTWKWTGYDIGGTNLINVVGGMLGHRDAALAADGWELTFTLTGGATASGTIRVIGEL